MKSSSSRAMHLPTLLSLVAVASAQTFSFGVGLGGTSDVIPAFDSQRSSSSSGSSSSANPFSNSRSAGLTFEDFFSSSRVGTQKQSTDTGTRSRSSSRSPNTVREATATTSAPIRRTPPTPNPTITNRGAPAPAPDRQTFRASSSTGSPRDTTSSRRSSPNRGAPFDASRVSAAEAVVHAQPDLSSRGRVQEAVVRDPITRPPSTTEANVVVDVRDNLVGQSVCARGVIGDACRKHLATTAMSCTSGFCQECQQCGTMSPDLWPRCCRDHFLCCRPLARACQSCDHPILTPFCGAAFGRCN